MNYGFLCFWTMRCIGIVECLHTKCVNYVGNQIRVTDHIYLVYMRYWYFWHMLIIDQMDRFQWVIKLLYGLFFFFLDRWVTTYDVFSWILFLLQYETWTMCFWQWKNEGIDVFVLALYISGGRTLTPHHYTDCLRTCNYCCNTVMLATSMYKYHMGEFNITDRFYTE